jgi:6-phosphogluconolactonase
MTIIEAFFDSRTLASQAVARHVAEAIRQQLGRSPRTAIIVGGGSTPAECFEILSGTDLQWDRVQIVPSDERCVPAGSDASNEGMIRRLLVTNRAADANLVPMYNEKLLPDNQCSAFEKRLKPVSRPFAISLLGMGADGHFASLFPDSDNLDEGLNAGCDKNCMIVRTAASAYPRMSLTLPALLDSTRIVLFFFGATKRKVYEHAKLHASAYPVSRLLHQELTPVHTVWAP